MNVFRKIKEKREQLKLQEKQLSAWTKWVQEIWLSTKLSGSSLNVHLKYVPKFDRRKHGARLVNKKSIG